MTVRDLIEKLSKADQDKAAYLDDGFSINLIEIESVYEDNTHNIVVISASELIEDQYDQIKVL